MQTSQISDTALRTALLLGAMLLVAGCERESRARAERVVLITCDTLRADHLGIYGYERETSPNLDAFARESVVFDNAWSTAPLTAPALAALMTGRLPDEVGVNSNHAVLPGEVKTLAEAAQEAGIPSAAVVSNWVLRARDERGAGFEQGFSSYDDRMEEREQNRPRYHERSASATTQAAIEWLASRRQDRFFLWVHYQDPHGPYTPPEAFLKLLQRPIPVEPPLGVGRTDVGLGEIPRYQVLGRERAPEYYRIRYDAEIRSFDHALGRLLDHLRSERLLDGALVIITADHGESLGEHDYWFTHGHTIFRELVRVPLIVRLPSGARAFGFDPEERRLTVLVGHVDLYGTVLDAFGLRRAAAHGVSLFEPRPPAERVLVQTLLRPTTPPERWNGATDGRYRFVTGPFGTRLYDLSRDPSETTDLAASDSARVRALARAFDEVSRALPLLRAPGAIREPDAEELEGLRDLGYVVE